MTSPSPTRRSASNSVRCDLALDVGAHTVRVVRAGQIEAWPREQLGGLAGQRVWAAAHDGAIPATRDALASAGVRAVEIAAATQVAAWGAGAGGVTLVVDAGRSHVTSTLAVDGRPIITRVLPFGGDNLDRHIVAWLRREARLYVHPLAAETLRREAGAASALEVHGHLLGTGEPAQVVVARDAVAAAIRDSLAAIVGMVVQTLQEAPPDAAADLISPEEHGGGVLLVGGLALQAGLAEQLREATGLFVLTPDAPELAVAHGLQRQLGRGPR